MMANYHDDFRPQPPPPRSSSSVWIWLILLLFVVPMLVCGGICGGFFLLGRRAAENVQEFAQEVVQEQIRSTPPLRLALEKIGRDRDVAERLGKPIRESLPSLFNYSGGTEGAEAEFRLPVSGPAGSAQVHIRAEFIEGDWWFHTLDVTFDDDGETISLVTEPPPIPLD
jgi:hypothetical protein